MNDNYDAYNPRRDNRPVIGFAVGTLLIIIGDALYGLSYYERQPTDVRLFFLSAVFGLMAGGLYIWGGRELARWMEGPLSRRWVGRAFSLFGGMIAVVHAYAGGLMIVFDAAARQPERTEFAAILSQMEMLYNVLSLPMFGALIVAYVWHGIETWRGRAGVPRWTLCVNPLLLVAIQQPIASLLWFPLRSAAWAGFIQLSILVLIANRERHTAVSP